MARPEPVGVAVVGCGTISHEYLRNLTSFPDLRVLFCADLDPGRAKAQADQYGVPAWGDTGQALDRPDVEIVVNLTVPAAHAAVAAAALAAGKHVWLEKPLALDTAAGHPGSAALLREGVSILLRTLYPMTPHVTHVLWVELGYAKELGDLLDAPLPQPAEDALRQDELELVVQVNGKLRGRIIVPANADEAAIVAAALADEHVRKFVDKPVRKVIYVPGKLINIVV